MTVEGRRNPPDPAFARAKLGLLFGCVFVQPIRWICHNSVNAVALLLLQPVEAVTMEELGSSDGDRLAPRFGVPKFRLNCRPRVSAQAVESSRFPQEQFGCVQPKV